LHEIEERCSERERERTERMRTLAARGCQCQVIVWVPYKKDFGWEVLPYYFFIVVCKIVTIK